MITKVSIQGDIKKLITYASNNTMPKAQTDRTEKVNRYAHNYTWKLQQSSLKS